MKPTQEQIIAWAREVWGDDSGKPWSEAALLHITQLATLAYEAGQESMKWDGIHSCHPDCQRPACVHTRKTYQEGYEAGRKDENETCAVMTNILQKSGVSEEHLADAIRARREQ
jgi:hypothetical protein